MPNGEAREVPVGGSAPEKEKSPEVPKDQGTRTETALKGADVRVPAAGTAPEAARAAVVSRQSAAPETKDKYRVRVERALEQNLWDLYFALPQGAREKFKAEGEKAAAALRDAVESKKVKPNQVLRPVLRWLKTIPKVNPYFLEQEAKIKTDMVMSLVKERRQEEGLE